MPTQQITLATHERRRRLRFPLETELRFQIVSHGQSEALKGTGTVQNISSRGLAFHSDTALQAGLRISVSLAWPVKLDECLLQLVFQGVVLRVRGNLAIVSVERPEFRTAGRSTAASREEIAAVAGGIQSLLASKRVPPGMVGIARQPTPLG